MVKQCSPIPSSSVLLVKISYSMTKDRIQTLCFGKSDATKLIKALDISIAHGHDGLSVKMIKICADSIAHPLTLIFQNSLAGMYLQLQVYLPIFGKKLTYFQFIKRMINKLF